MAVTLKMLSEYTGYSTATISRVLNHDPTMSVNEETRCAIFEAAKELGYSGGSGRRTQRASSSSITVGIAEMLSPEEKVRDSYFLYLKSFIEQSCFDNNIMIISLFENEEGYGTLDDKKLDGIIAIGYFISKQIRSLELLSDNITFVDSSPNELLHDSVVINYDLGIRQALDYLMQLGHTRIGFIGPRRLRDDPEHIILEPRRSYYEHYMRKKRLYNNAWILDAPLRNQEEAAELVSYLYTSQPVEQAPSALITVNEECAIAAARALRKLNFRIPKEISIISFNDTLMAAAMDPPLTSISPHLDYMAKTAVQLVMQRASSPTHPKERKYPQKIVLPPELIQRGSTAANST